MLIKGENCKVKSNLYENFISWYVRKIFGNYDMYFFEMILC